MELFERALRARLRFNSPVGQLTTEQLWELPLTAKGDKPSLDVVAKIAHRQLQDLGETSFVETADNPEKAKAELRMEVVKHVIAARQKDAETAAKAAETRQYKQQLLEALSEKQSDALKGMSEEQIKAELAKLDAA